MLSLDQLLPDDHRARAVWQYVEQLDLTPLYDLIRAVEGHVGRAPIDPRILVSLWLYATVDGVGSARRLDRLCSESHDYQWLCGGVGVNHHTLSDFRVEHAEFLDQLLTQSVAALLHQELIEIRRVAQDGTRVRAAAGGSSFRRRPTLEECLVEAESHLRELQQEADEDSAAEDRRQRGARERAARERAERIRRAIAELPEVEAKLESRKKGSGESARTSTTDPEARRMKMADGGFRPAYNVQFATTTDSRVIIGCDVTNQGSDHGQIPPMLAQIEDRYGRLPQEHLVDGGYANLHDIEHAAGRGVVLYAPIKDERKKRERGEHPFAPRKRDSAGVAAWRQRMGTAEAQAIYPERAASAEFVNAGARNRGLQQFVVRGLNKVKAIALWQALAHNFLRTLNLQTAALAAT